MFNTEKLENLYLQIIKIGTLISVFLPIFAYDKFIFPFVFPRTIVFRIIVELLIVAYASLIIIKPKYRPRWSMLTGIFTGFIAIMLLASIFGADTYHSFWSSIERSEGIILWLHLFALFIISTNVFREKKDWLLIFNGVIMAGWLQAFYALMQYFNAPLALQYGGSRIGGSIGNASFLATYLIFVIYLAGWLAGQYEEHKFRAYYIVFILVNAFILWQTQTRGAILALLGSLFIGLSIWLWQKKSAKAKFAVAAIWLAALLAGSLLLINKDSEWVNRSKTLSRLVNISTTDITTQNRLIVWGSGLEGFKERPWLGWGWENFNVAFNRHFDPAITRDIGSQPWYDRAHNVIVETAVATGIFGLLAYLAMLAWPTIMLLKSKKRKAIPAENIILTSLLAAYFLQNLFVFDTLPSYTLFMLLLAYILAIYGQHKKNSRKLFTKATVGPVKGLALPLVLLAAMAGLSYYLNARPVLANHYVVKAVTQDDYNIFITGQSFNRAFDFSPPNDQELRFILVQQAREMAGRYGINEKTLPLVQLAIQEMEKSLVASPESIQNYLLLAEMYLAALPLDQGYLPKAEELMHRALEKAPSRYQIYTMLGRLSMEKGEFGKGVEYFQTAISLNDQFAEAHWNLAIANILSGNFAEAALSLERARTLQLPIDQPQYQNKLLQAYKDSQDLKATIDYLKLLNQQYPENEAYRQSLESLQSLYDQVIEKAKEGF